MCESSRIDATSREVWRHIAGARRRRQEGARVRKLMGFTDAMIAELELLNLRGVERVGLDWKRRLTLLFSALPFRYCPSLRAHPSPTEVLDVLFDVQTGLLDLKWRLAAPVPGPRRSGWRTVARVRR